MITSCFLQFLLQFSFLTLLQCLSYHTLNLFHFPLLILLYSPQQEQITCSPSGDQAYEKLVKGKDFWNSCSPDLEHTQILCSSNSYSAWSFLSYMDHVWLFYRDTDVVWASFWELSEENQCEDKWQLNFLAILTMEIQKFFTKCLPIPVFIEIAKRFPLTKREPFLQTSGKDREF